MRIEQFFVEEEMQERANELSAILQKEVKSGFDVIVGLVSHESEENRQWSLIRKDQSRVTVRVSVCSLKDVADQHIGYVCTILEVAIFG